MSNGEHVDGPQLAARMARLKAEQGQVFGRMTDGQWFAEEPLAAVAPLLQEAPDSYQVGGDHYKAMKVRPWDAMEAWASPEKFQGYLLLSAVGYLARVETHGVTGKGGRQDVEKARHCLDKLLSVWPE